MLSLQTWPPTRPLTTNQARQTSRLRIRNIYRTRQHCQRMYSRTQRALASTATPGSCFERVVKLASNIIHRVPIGMVCYKMSSNLE